MKQYYFNFDFYIVVCGNNALKQKVVYSYMVTVYVNFYTTQQNNHSCVNDLQVI
jgi:hypothetical protein